MPDNRETPAKVLVIDDEDAARFGIVRALRQEGYLVEEAADGAAAAARVEEFQPDVIVSDINMPLMDGLTLLRLLNQNAEPPLVVLVTAYGSEGVAAEALRAGAYDYLPKPFDLEELRLAVRHAVEKRRLIRQNRFYYQELERTLAELKQSQAALLQAEKMASLGRLVASIAHEINTPLGVLESNIETLAQAAQKIVAGHADQPSKAPDSTRRAVEALSTAAALSQAACERVTAIVQNLRRFARLDEADFQRAQVHRGLDSALALLRHELGERIQVVKEFGDLPAIDCDPRQLNQLFMNLLQNAIEAIRRGPGWGLIRVRTRPQNGRVTIEIEDTGCGISPEKLSRIFEPSVTSKGSRMGASFGLAICYQIVQAHQGTIEVESRPGQGARFTVTLPVDRPS